MTKLYKTLFLLNNFEKKKKYHSHSERPMTKEKKKYIYDEYLSLVD